MAENYLTQAGISDQDTVANFSEGWGLLQLFYFILWIPANQPLKWQLFFKIAIWNLRYGLQQYQQSLRAIDSHIILFIMILNFNTLTWLTTSPGMTKEEGFNRLGIGSCDELTCIIHIVIDQMVFTWECARISLLRLHDEKLLSLSWQVQLPGLGLAKARQLNFTALRGWKMIIGIHMLLGVPNLIFCSTVE